MNEGVTALRMLLLNYQAMHARGELQTAAELIERAIYLHPADATYRNTLGVSSARAATWPAPSPPMASTAA